MGYRYIIRNAPYGGVAIQSRIRNDYSFDGQKYYVDVHIRSQCYGHPDRIHQEKWAYPLKVLIVPAFVVDVITFPIQVYVEVLKLGSGF